jgi:hypothetical protein
MSAYDQWLGMTDVAQHEIGSSSRLLDLLDRAMGELRTYLSSP